MIRNNLERCRLSNKPEGISKAALARKIGVSRSYITRIEKGERVPSVPILFKLSRALGCPVTAIIEDLSTEGR